MKELQDRTSLPGFLDSLLSRIGIFECDAKTKKILEEPDFFTAPYSRIGGDNLETGVGQISSFRIRSDLKWCMICLLELITTVHICVKSVYSAAYAYALRQALRDDGREMSKGHECSQKGCSIIIGSAIQMY
ncbi:unnamed protein product [Cylicocyclus nassatus]|uniref:Uncharacterized protein n=1 Tax=Cylicocyclus nassatus TaxID=53992 RepID=A0AA36GGW5_CYLNA|nr:unnamed protein product [Cylicocyclus nassatus]